MKNTFESHSERLEQEKDRILGPKDKIDIKEEFLEKDSRVVKGKHTVIPSKDQTSKP
jgi:hypothetical protein